MYADRHFRGIGVHIESRLLRRRELTRSGSPDGQAVTLCDHAKVARPLPSGQVRSNEWDGACCIGIRLVGGDRQEMPGSCIDRQAAMKIIRSFIRLLWLQGMTRSARPHYRTVTQVPGLKCHHCARSVPAHAPS